MLRAGALLSCLLLLGAAACAPDAPVKKVLILGFDGLDPQITRRLIAEGKLPTFARLEAEGGFRELATSTPAESPVAWSNFITGLNPGGHGIYDFIHRDPTTMVPYLSSTTTEEPGWNLGLGKWRFPLWPGGIRLNRSGRAFWEILDEHGVPSTIIRVPANYPPTGSSAQQLSGMGTPDLDGTYGTFSLYSDEPEGSRGEIGGGTVFYVKVVEDRVEGRLPGPPNTFKKDQARVWVPFEVFVDPTHPVAKIAIQGQQIVLKTGEWSDWTRVSFQLLPLLASADGMVRFYLKQVRPDFLLYVSPVNVDPTRPVLPISNPARFSRGLAERVGLFSTLGIPEDTKAVSAGILTEAEFLEQSQLLHAEETRLLDDQLKHFTSGVLFFYSGRADQLQHMFWRPMEESSESPSGRVIEQVYRDMDGLLNRALAKAGPATLVIAMSDHGFTGFHRAFSLNNWLADNGYAARCDSPDASYLAGFDWSRTRAYGLGFAGLYLNSQGRERNGTVTPRARDALLDELASRLVRVRDPDTGAQVITRVLRGDRIYSGTEKDKSPDLVICYNRGYRASWESVVGLFSETQLADNRDPWSGDHLMDPDLVPGVLFANRRITADRPSLLDLAPTLLAEFGVPKAPEMTGQPVF
jgi:predicted AlkP superfamily phosphohydrolase/phosphomutase